MRVLYRLMTAAIAASVAMCAVSTGIGQAYAQSTPTSVLEKPTRRRASRSSKAH
jgi:O-acetyl-ADP-ribose deacetylase (regulator of RNase III)